MEDILKSWFSKKFVVAVHEHYYQKIQDVYKRQTILRKWLIEERSEMPAFDGRKCCMRREP